MVLDARRGRQHLNMRRQQLGPWTSFENSVSGGLHYLLNVIRRLASGPRRSIALFPDSVDLRCVGKKPQIQRSHLQRAPRAPFRLLDLSMLISNEGSHAHHRQGSMYILFSDAKPLGRVWGSPLSLCFVYWRLGADAPIMSPAQIHNACRCPRRKSGDNMQRSCFLRIDPLRPRVVYPPHGDSSCTLMMCPQCGTAIPHLFFTAPLSKESRKRSWQAAMSLISFFFLNFKMLTTRVSV